MLKVKIEVHTNSTDKNVKWHDLMTQEGIKNAYQHLDEIHENDNDYIISNVQTDWARFDSNTSLDDMIETVVLLKNMMDDEVRLFKEMYKECTHEPIDIATNILNNEMKYVEDVEEDDEIWETVFFDKEQREIAILY